jgi:arylsulfatase A-like enzyme
MKKLTPLAFLPLAIACSTDKNHEEKKKNILFILVDDYGWNDVSYNQTDFYETPNIDKIAAEGVVFTNGYAACQVSSPSRASLMTGQFTARHGITDWIGARSGETWREKHRFSKLLPAEYKHSLSQEYLTLPEALKENGYLTFFAGKWHVGSEEDSSLPENHGFDINIGGWEKGSPKGGYFDPYKNPKLPNRKPGESLSIRLAKETANFIESNKDTNFLAYLSFYAVHSPLQTSKAKWEKYRNKADSMGIADSAYKMGKFLPIRQVQDNPVYGGLVETMDDAVGIVLNKLKELGIEDHTIICFTSDNGGVAAGDDFSTSNLPLRAGKGYQFEGGIRIPFIIKAPGIAPGKTNTPATGADFYPTLLDLVGAELKPSAHVDGASLVPALKGQQISDRPLIWHYPHYGNQGGEPSSIVRYGDYKLIHYYEDGRNELYDLSTDLGETNDISKENSGKVNELYTMLTEYLESVGAILPKHDPLYDSLTESEHLEHVKNNLMPSLEQNRLKMLKKDFNPNKDWWGSMVED